MKILQDQMNFYSRNHCRMLVLQGHCPLVQRKLINHASQRMLMFSACWRLQLQCMQKVNTALAGKIHAKGVQHDTSSVVAGSCKLAESPASICSASRNLTTEGATATGCRVASEAGRGINLRKLPILRDDL